MVYKIEELARKYKKACECEREYIAEIRKLKKRVKDLKEINEEHHRINMEILQKKGKLYKYIAHKYETANHVLKRSIKNEYYQGYYDMVGEILEYISLELEG